MYNRKHYLVTTLVNSRNSTACQTSLRLPCTNNGIRDLGEPMRLKPSCEVIGSQNAQTIVTCQSSSPAWTLAKKPPQQHHNSSAQPRISHAPTIGASNCPSLHPYRPISTEHGVTAFLPTLRDPPPIDPPPTRPQQSTLDAAAPACDCDLPSVIMGIVLAVWRVVVDVVSFWHKVR